jgi:hypothetical protein
VFSRTLAQSSSTRLGSAATASSEEDTRDDCRRRQKKAEIQSRAGAGERVDDDASEAEDEREHQSDTDPVPVNTPEHGPEAGAVSRSAVAARPARPHQGRAMTVHASGNCPQHRHRPSGRAWPLPLRPDYVHHTGLLPHRRMIGASRLPANAQPSVTPHRVRHGQSATASRARSARCPARRE